MAHAFSITDGTTTFSLSTTSSMLVNYQMGTLEEGDETVTDTVDLLIYAASGALVQTAVRTLQTLIDGAKRRTEWKQGPKVYVQAQLDSDASAWRSEIRRARLEMNEKSLAVWANFKIECTLYIERVPWWEGARTQFTLTNGNGTNNTSGLTVYSHNDGTAGNDNYADINAAEVTGDLPAPVELQMTNNNGASRAWANFWMASNCFNDPTGFFGVVEAESRTSGGTVTGNAGSSGANYNTQSVNGTASWLYSLASSFLQDCNGYLFRLLACFSTAPSGGFVRAKLTIDGGTTVLYQTDEVALGGGGVVDLGVLPVPPGGYSTGYGGLEMQITFRTPSALAMSVDFFQFLPAHSCRNLYQTGGTMLANEIAVCDEIEERYYVTDGTLEYPYFVPRGEPLRVWPGRDARLYFILQRQASGAFEAEDTLSVKAWYRPRRATI